jgi:Family of unknown function (DUF6221)
MSDQFLIAWVAATVVTVIGSLVWLTIKRDFINEPILLLIIAGRIGNILTCRWLRAPSSAPSGSGRGMATDLTEFLLARIAEDEARALGSPHLHRHQVTGGGESSLADDVHTGPRGAGAPRLEYAHTYGPARVLAECEAKRLVIQAVDSMEARIAQEWGESDDDPDPIMVMAAVYADHPDYHAEWRQAADQLVHDLAADRARYAAQQAPE